MNPFLHRQTELLRRSASKVKTKKVIKLIPLLLTPFASVSQKSFLAKLKKLKIETKPVYDTTVFSLLPNYQIPKITDFCSIKNIETRKTVFAEHELMLVSAHLLEKTLKSLSKNKKLAPKLEILTGESLESREDFRSGLLEVHEIFKEAHTEILDDAFTVVGFKKLTKALIENAEEEIKAHPKSRIFSMKIQRIIGALKNL